jgi:hypothetical protein
MTLHESLIKRNKQTYVFDPIECIHSFIHSFNPDPVRMRSLRVRSFPNEIILLICKHLDAITLLAARSTCSQWRSLIDEFQSSLFRYLYISRFGHISRPNSHALQTGASETVQADRPLLSWAQMYAYRHLFMKGKCSFRRGYANRDDETPARTSQPEPPFSDKGKQPAVFDNDHTTQHQQRNQQQERKRDSYEYVATWPIYPIEPYSICIDPSVNRLCYVDRDRPMEIIAQLLPTPPPLQTTENPDNNESAFIQLRSPVKSEDCIHMSAEYHTLPVRLLLSNQEGTLLSFDESSKIVVW